MEEAKNQIQTQNQRIRELEREKHNMIPLLTT